LGNRHRCYEPRICPARHCGALPYPKLVSLSGDQHSQDVGTATIICGQTLQGERLSLDCKTLDLVGFITINSGEHRIQLRCVLKFFASCVFDASCYNGKERHKSELDYFAAILQAASVERANLIRAKTLTVVECNGKARWDQPNASWTGCLKPHSPYAARLSPAGTAGSVEKCRF
jgi:hypothetical protein